MEVSPWLAMNSRPNMVENHFGLTDITQSIDMKVTLSAQKMSPGGASLANLPWTALWPSVSSCLPHLLNSQPIRVQPPK